MAANLFRANCELLQHVLEQDDYFRSTTNPSARRRVGKHELRTLYLYWLSKPVRDLCYFRNISNTKQQQQQIQQQTQHPKQQNCFDDDPLQAADMLLRWMMDQFSTVAQTPSEKHIIAEIIEHVLRNTNMNDSVNAGLCRLLSLHLMPLQGTKAALQDHGRRTEDSAVQHVASLLSATHVYNIMQQLHNDPVYFPHMRPDIQSYQSILNLYGKRCRLLVLLGPPPRSEGVHSPRIRRGVEWSAPDTIEALGGYFNPRDCIKASMDLIQTMQDAADSSLPDQSLSRPKIMHYSMLLSMMSYAAGMEGHCSSTNSLARDALVVLQSLESDPSIYHADVALYNPVLLAFVQEATYFFKHGRYDLQLQAQSQCEALWAHMKETFEEDENLSADPITYSIMMKLYRDVNQAEKAEAILETMEAAATVVSTTTVEDWHTFEDTGPALEVPVPTLMHYNTVLNAFAKSTQPFSTEKVMSLLRRMEEQTTATGLPLHNIVPQPDRISYTSALDALLRAQNVEDVIDRISMVLLDRFEANEDPQRRPDAVTYNVLFHSLLRRLRQHTDPNLKLIIANNMENMLRRLKENSSHFRVVAGSRVFRYYNDCMRGWAHTNSLESAERAMRLLREMEDDLSSGRFPSAQPNGTTYQAVLATISMSSCSSALPTAIEILEKMEKVDVPVTVNALQIFLGILIKHPFEGSVDETETMFVNTILDRFRAKVGRQDGVTAGWVFEGIFNHLNEETDTRKRHKTARRFEKLFRALLLEPHFFRLNDDNDMTVYYNKCLKAWAFTQTRDSTAHALRILHEMEQKSKAQSILTCSLESCQPNAKTYEYILTCLSRSPDAISVQTARSIFRKMDLNGTPIILSVLNRFIRILVKSNSNGCLEEAEHIINGVVDNYLVGNDSLCPNESTYAILVDGWMRRPGAIRDVDRVLKKMQDVSTKTQTASLVPSAKMYKELMQLWSTSLAADAMERVDDLFRRMTERNPPDSSDYAMLQAAWGESRRPDAPQRVESILISMQEEFEKTKNESVRPTVTNFGRVIHCWATSKQNGSADRADAILQRLEDLCFTDRGTSYNYLVPSTICYEGALLGWALSDNAQAAQRALSIFDRMKKAHDLSPSTVSINQSCYHHLIQTLAKTHTSGKAAKCYEILEEMRNSYETGDNRYGRPTHETFHTILRVCSTCTGSDGENEAADVALKVMHDYLLFAGASPRKNVFLEFLYTVFRLIPNTEARDESVKSIFKGCPRSILDCPTTREALSKTVSSHAFTIIIERCVVPNPLLAKLVKNRIERLPKLSNE